MDIILLYCSVYRSPLADISLGKTAGKFAVAADIQPTLLYIIILVVIIWINWGQQVKIAKIQQIL